MSEPREVNAADPPIGTFSDPPDLKRSAVHGLFWLSAGNAVRAVLRIVVLAVLARLLTPRDFGLVAAAGAVTWFSSIFSGLGVGPALVQRDELEPRHISTGLTSSLGLGVLIAVLIYAFAPQIANLFRMDGFVPVLRGMALVFPITALSVVGECLLQRDMKFASISGIELAAYAVGYGMVGIVLAWLGFGVWALVAAEVTKAIFKTGLFFVFVPRATRFGFDGGAFRDLMRFGSGYTLGNLSGYFALQGDNLVIARFLGPASLGLYSRAYELMVVPSSALGTMLHKILFPMLSRVQGDPTRLRLAYRRGLALVAAVVLPVSVATVVLAPEIIQTLLGDGWEGAVLPLRILSLAMYFRIGYMVGGSVASSTGAVYRSAWRSTAYAVLVVAGAWIGRSWGLPGVAAGVAVAVAIHFALVSQLSNRLTGLSLGSFLALHAPALSLTTVLGGVVYGMAYALRSTDLAAPLILIGVGAAAGATALLLFRLAPRYVIGEDGAAILRTVCDHAPARVRPWLRRALLPQR